VEVQTFRLGPYRTNCHLLIDGRKVWIVDPGFDGDALAAHITSHDLEVQAVILTHSHWDHVLGLPGLCKAFDDLPIHVHAADAFLLGKEGVESSRRFAMTVDPDQRVIPRSLWEDVPEPTQVLADGDRIEGCNLIVIHTPGHTPGSICLYQETQELLFSGDTLFAGTIGRTDLPYSDPRAIIPSIRERLFPLRDTTVVYPGHGPSTTIGREKKNPWFLD